ncbi:hypothetical protein BO78DRAFT_442008 [Aspergillus sclerotiicarbonarius CBS 121057]|uniref:F-box domain-containing protein n=1 Tax=Aspergillus sclerotiicarbonarius (strain CBS 121057 / IBT 28362) TaxID=1448318 RepID=A0A319EF43_ASPSB|nr:hypothetical protein BO78DRAFT_442008 [Aspergillus sclerotiicarbonarius CBS 121057]
MNHLPTEILLFIGEYTVKHSHWRERCRTLHALVLCCQRFYNIFQSLLYHYLILGEFLTKEVRLVMHLWKHPELASQARKLKLCWPSDDDQCLRLGDYKDDEQSRVEFIDQALQEIFTSEEKETESKWREWLHNFREEAWVGVLLVRLAHLESIEFGHERSELITPPFPFMQEVHAHCVVHYSAIDQKIITPFFYFPNVRSITGSDIWATAEGEHVLDPCDIIQPSYSVRKITVYGIYHCHGMLDWLAVCRELEHLYIQAASHPDDEEILYPFDAMVFYQALLPFRQTLRTLDVTYNPLYNDRLIDNNGWNLEKDNIPFQSLREFSVLQDLIIRHAHLMLISCSSSRTLRLSLRKLSIRDIVEDFSIDLVSELQSLVTNRDALPHLVTLELGEKGIRDENAISKKSRYSLEFGT